MPNQRTEVEEAVRSYLTKLAVRYIPLVALIGVMALVVALVPTVPQQNGEAAGFETEQYGLESPDGQVAGEPAQDSGQASPDVGDGTGKRSDATKPGTSLSEGGATQPPASGQQAVAKGKTKSGVACRPGVRQVKWSAYAPQCVGKWNGDNGGATAQGVTAKTITLTYRRSNSAQDSALAQSQRGALETDAAYIDHLNKYIKLFNEEYELYGRRVVLKPYNGQGDYIKEHMGQNDGGAQADAATARKIGGFGDVTNAVKMTRQYATGLAHEKLIAFNTLQLPDAFYQRYRPYQYSYLPSGDKAAQWYINVICQRMKGLSAIYAGDGSYQKTKRVFGMASPDSGDYKMLNDKIERGLNQCGVKIARRVNFSSDSASFVQQSANFVSQMQSARVTSVICFCAAASLSTMTEQSNSQGYRPEWLAPNVGDPSARNNNQREWSSAIVPGDWYFVSSVPRKSSEAYLVFKKAAPNAEPAGNYYAMAYYSLAQIYGALQGAGPNLNPATFERAMFSMIGGKGDAGTWKFGNGSYTPAVDSQVMWWNRNGTSNFDGRSGRYEACDNGAFYPIRNAGAWGKQGSQLRCYGK